MQQLAKSGPRTADSQNSKNPEPRAILQQARKPRHPNPRLPKSDLVTNPLQTCPPTTDSMTSKAQVSPQEKEDAMPSKKNRAAWKLLTLAAVLQLSLAPLSP